jgi:prevent-host-death family protein
MDQERSTASTSDARDATMGDEGFVAAPFAVDEAVAFLTNLAAASRRYAAVPHRSPAAAQISWVQAAQFDRLAQLIARLTPPEGAAPPHPTHHANGTPSAGSSETTTLSDVSVAYLAGAKDERGHAAAFRAARSDAEIEQGARNYAASAPPEGASPARHFDTLLGAYEQAIQQNARIAGMDSLSAYHEEEEVDEDGPRTALLSYLHDIETQCDPAGEVQHRRSLEEQVAAVPALQAELDALRGASPEAGGRAEFTHRGWPPTRATSLAVSAFTSNTRTILRRVQNGESIELTQRGKAVAVLVPRREYDRLAALAPSSGGKGEA